MQKAAGLWPRRLSLYSSFPCRHTQEPIQQHYSHRDRQRRPQQHRPINAEALPQQLEQEDGGCKEKDGLLFTRVFHKALYEAASSVVVYNSSESVISHV